MFKNLRDNTKTGKPDRVAEYIGQAIIERMDIYEDEMRHAISLCESPIEQLLIAALFHETREGPTKFVFMVGHPFNKEPAYDQAVFVWPQANVGAYRVDVLLLDASRPISEAPPRLMVVECDGHNFHEKTKEQVRKDKTRDRYLQSVGCKVLHYTGSEIWADPKACAQEIICETAVDDAWRGARK